jgi:alkylation response protein AidB-like acyl-CoA dehydrogenase
LDGTAVDLLPSSDQLELVAAAAEFLAEQAPVSSIRTRRHDPAALDPKIWAAGADLGLLGLSAPEDVGGSDRGLEDEALLFRELGRRLVPGPFLASVLGARVAARGGRPEIAREIVAGRDVVALAELRGGTVHTTALRGRVDVFDPVGSRFVLVVDPGGAALVETAELGELTAVECVDPGTRLATSSAVSAPVVCAVPADEQVHLRALVLVSAALVGIAEATRDQSTAHAKTRVQFGRPIGVNQAVKHACADMAVAAEAALSQVLFAAVSLGSGRPDAEFQVLATKAVAGRAARRNGAANIQIHGGMGYTYEHDAHLYMKRAHVLDEQFGRTGAHLGRLLQLEAAQ